uniref:Uncharacterized protein n=1 Tax=Anguilla anguilla TaxID=7936 RepID=A0A0E9UTP7_ANGAN
MIGWSLIPHWFIFITSESPLPLKPSLLMHTTYIHILYYMHLRKYR